MYLLRVRDEASKIYGIGKDGNAIQPKAGTEFVVKTLHPALVSVCDVVGECDPSGRLLPDEADDTQPAKRPRGRPRKLVTNPAIENPAPVVTVGDVTPDQSSIASNDGGASGE